MDARVPDLIQWHEGLLLTPQHFQQLSLRMEGLVQALPGLYVPFGWGIRTFELDGGDFTSGVLTVRSLDAVMPDGLHVVFSSEREQVQLDLRPLSATLRQKPLLVHLATPLGEGQTPAALYRFSSYEGDPVADENDVVEVVSRNSCQMLMLPQTVASRAGLSAAAASTAQLRATLPPMRPVSESRLSKFTSEAPSLKESMLTVW